MHGDPTPRPRRGFAADVLARSCAEVPNKAASALRELDHRYSDGIDVRLLWDPQTDRVLVAVADERVGDAFVFEIDAEQALDGFHHPYAYVSHDHNDVSCSRDDIAFEPRPQTPSARKRQR